jgi:hypothetical protein
MCRDSLERFSTGLRLMSISNGRARRCKFSVCHGSQALAPNGVYVGSVVLILKIGHGLAGGDGGKAMSRNPTAYLAIVGALAFAPPGAASAGQVNIPHINIARPQISVPTPHPSVPTPHLSIPRPQISVPTPRLSSPKLTTHDLVYFPKLTPHGNAAGPSKWQMRDKTVTLGNPTASSPGSASAMPVSNTGGYPTVETPSFRCRSKGGISNCI